MAIGVDWERIMDSCPKELEAYDVAHERKLLEQDYLNHLWWGSYGLSAVSVAVERCLAGKKSKQKYIEKPILKEVFGTANLTDEQKFEKELQKALLAEEQWIAVSKKKGLPETII